MLLTDQLIDDLHAFRVGMMSRFVTGPGQDGRAIGGGFASFAGKGSPLSQAYGLGHRDASFDLDELEEFYAGRATNWELIVTPFASSDVMKNAVIRGYVPDHFETVMVQQANPVHAELPPGFSIQEVGDDLDLWLKVSESGWGETNELPEHVSEMTMSMAANRSVRRYLAWVHGEPAATAGLCEHEGKFLFAGASTRPQFRGRGLQQLLTQRRLANAGAGALVQVVTAPGTKSHRNAQRAGFQPLYSKLVSMRHG